MLMLRKNLYCEKFNTKINVSTFKGDAVFSQTNLLSLWYHAQGCLLRNEWNVGVFGHYQVPGNIGVLKVTIIGVPFQNP